MQRRNFLLGLLSTAGAGSGTSSLLSLRGGADELEAANDQRNITQPAAGSKQMSSLVTSNVKDYGAVGDAAADDGAAFQAAIDAAVSSKVRSVYVPPGTYLIRRTLTLTDTKMFGIGHPAATTLQWDRDLGANTFAIKLRASSSELESPMSLENLRVVGPQVRPTAPVMNGIQIANYSENSKSKGRARFTEVHVGQFWFGFVADNIDGHDFWLRCQINNNHDGVYFRTAGNDYRFVECGFEGNTRAGLTAQSDCPLHRLELMRCHLGQQPVGVYKAPGTTDREFLSSARFYDTSFEYIGNAAILSQATATGEGDTLQDVFMDMTGFSWAPKNPPQYDSSLPRDAAIRCSRITRGLVEINSDMWPFTPGDTGSGLAVVKLSGYSTGGLIFNYRGTLGPSSTETLLNATGVITRRNAVNCVEGERVIGITVPGGQSSGTVNVQMNRYVAHLDAFRAHVTPRSDIGSRSYWVTWAASGANVNITVNLGAAVTADCRFDIAIQPVVET
jgi:hypothetical protein